MNLKTLRNNVCSREIAKFLAGPALLALILAVLPVSPESKVVGYGFCVLIWSLWFPGRSENRRTLPKTVVDFWYYGLAVIGVALFFIADSAQRDKMSLAEAYKAAGALLIEAELRKELFIEVTGEGTKILSALKAEAQRTATIANETWTGYCSQAILNRDPKKIIDERAIICRDALTNAANWEAVAAIDSVEELKKIISEKKLDYSYKAPVNGEMVPIATIARYLSFKPQSEEWQEQLRWLDRQMEGTRRTRDSAKEKYKVSQPIDDPSAYSTTGRITSFLWPYVLIAALGMKLARERYAYPS